MIWTNWQRPGFELGLELERVCREHPNAKGAILGQHGLINWANDDKECYLLTLDLIRRAQEFLDARAGKAGLRRREGAVAPGGGAAARAGGGAAVAARQGERGEAADRDGRDARRSAGVRELARRAAAGGARDELPRPLPAHEDQAALRRTGIREGGDVDVAEEVLEAGLEQYRADYAEYYEHCKRADSPAIRVSSPSVILIPGVGMVAWGKSKSESRVTAEFYNAAIGVMRGAERVSQYIALDRQEAFDIEYWLLEEAKLKRMPAEKPLDRQVAGRRRRGQRDREARCSRGWSAEGASVVAHRPNADCAAAAADELQKKVGMGIGVAGTGISGAGQVVGLGADMTDRAAIRKSLAEAIFAYGGVDQVVVTAGYYPNPDDKGEVGDHEWARAFAINVTGPYLVADEA